jgi:hypothetical protein
MYRECILNCQKHHMCNCQRNLQIGTSLEECVSTFSNEFLQVENWNFMVSQIFEARGVKLVQSVVSLDH